MSRPGTLPPPPSCRDGQLRCYQSSHPDLVLMAITSQIKPSPAFGEVTVEHWETAGLIKPSVILPIFTTVEKGLIIRKMGKLHAEDQQRLKMTIQKILG